MALVYLNVFIAIIALQFFYFVFIFSKFIYSKKKTTHSKNLSVSVIVCAKNKKENVTKHIPLLIEQDYKNFEILLIDDASTDGTLDVFEKFEKENQQVKIVRVANNETFWGNKKFALTMGIKAAKNDYLLFIDADCYPNSQEWISEIMAQFNDDKTIVLGYGAYSKIKSSFLNKIIRFETLFTAIQYFSWASFNKPYMGVGRNLAYKKSEFFKVNGYIKHMKIKSGDDDLFINQASDRTNTASCYSPKSFTISITKQTFKEWLQNKRRHIWTAKYYKFSDKLQLIMFYTSQLLFIFFSIYLLLLQYQIITVISLIALRYLFCWIIVYKSAKKLNEYDLVILYPILEIILVLTQTTLFLVNIISKPKL